MRNILKTSLLALPLLMLSGAALAADATGRWKTIDDGTGKVKSIVEIYKTTNGTLAGKVDEILQSDHGPNPCATSARAATRTSRSRAW
jgi:hypothetical protein